jgi:hypothetical protein
MSVPELVQHTDPVPPVEMVSGGEPFDDSLLQFQFKGWDHPNESIRSTRQNWPNSPLVPTYTYPNGAVTELFRLDGWPILLANRYTYK